MDTIIAAPASCAVRSVIRFLHTERQRQILLTEFMTPGTTITSDIYCETLHKLRRSIQNKRRGMLSKGVVLPHDNARPHTAACTNALIKLFNWEIFDHPPYSLDLAPSDYHLFSKIKVLVGYPTFPHQRRAHGWRQNLAA